MSCRMRSRSATRWAADLDVKLQKAVIPFKLLKAITVRMVEDTEESGFL